MLSIVLYNPEIPGNTGNIGRLCVNVGAELHLIKPIGFDIDDRSARRAGLDYWRHLQVKVWDNLEHFRQSLPQPANVFYFSTKAKRIFWQAKFKEGDYLVFGPETRGLPERLLQENHDNSFKIPMFSENARSLNLANAVSVVTYEALRQVCSNDLS